MKEDKSMDELFRDKLLNYEQEPPVYLLEKILAGAAAAQRKRKLIYWRIAGVAAALLIAFGAGWQFNALRNDIGQPILVEHQALPDFNIHSNEENVIQKPETEHRQIASLSKSSEIEIETSTLIASEPGSKMVSSTAKVESIPSSQESQSLYLLQNRSGRIRQKSTFSTSLQERKISRSISEFAEKSIDQQIMEQNKQLILAENESDRKARWLVGAQISPAYTVSRSNHSQEYASNMLNSSSSNPVDLGGGISVEYKKGKRWSIQSGVYYSGLGQSSGNSSPAGNRNSMYADLGSEYFNTPVNIVEGSNNMMMNSTAGVIELKSIPSGTVMATSPEEKIDASSVILSQASFVQNFEYIEIPLYLRYKLIDSKFDIEVLGGFSSNLLVGNETFMESNSEKSLVGKTQNMQTLNYSGTLGFGLKYGLSNRIFLNIEPRVKYYLNSLNSNSSVTYKPYTIGVFTGLSYEF